MDDTIEGSGDTLVLDPAEDQTPEGETPEPKEAAPEDKSRRSEIAQKIKYREKFQAAESKVQKLEAELEELRGAVKKPTDDAEAKAQEYIRKQARDVYEELQREKQKEEGTKLAKLSAEVEEIIEENPDISEAELLDAIEEYDVEPKTALKILQKQDNRGAKKPKMPVARQGSPEAPKQAPDDSKKSMWDIQKEEIARLRSS